MGIDKCIFAEWNGILVKQRLKRLAEPDGVVFDWHGIEMEDQQKTDMAMLGWPCWTRQPCRHRSVIKKLREGSKRN